MHLFGRLRSRGGVAAARRHVIGRRGLDAERRQHDEQATGQRPEQGSLRSAFHATLLMSPPRQAFARKLEFTDIRIRALAKERDRSSFSLVLAK